jgi:Holliday junction resolvase
MRLVARGQGGSGTSRSKKKIDIVALMHIVTIFVECTFASSH